MYGKTTAAAALMGAALIVSPVQAGTDAQDAQKLVNESTGVVQKMEQDSHLVQLLKRAKGVFIVPEFGKGAFIVGGRGGAGVLLAKAHGHWSDPAFYGLGGISIGAQAGGSGGQIAMLLMTDKAVNDFRGKSNFSLNANAGLSIINYSANSQASWGKGDIIVWSNTNGAFAGASVSATDVGASTDDNAAYYPGSPTPGQILDGSVKSPKAAKLVDALPV